MVGLLEFFHPDALLRCRLGDEWNVMHDELLLEAWERMIYGGIQFGALGSGYAHRDWSHDSLGVSHDWQLRRWLTHGLQGRRVTTYR